MHIQDFFQNFLKLFLVGLYDNCTINLIAHDMSPGISFTVHLPGDRSIGYVRLGLGRAAA